MRINLNAIKAASYAMSDDPSRLYICGVNLDFGPHGIIAVATDGSILIAARASAEPHEPASVTIPAETVKRLKYKPRNPDAELTQGGNGTWHIEYEGALWAFRPLGVDYPAWRRVLPTHSERGEYAHFNPDYLATMKKAGAVLGSHQQTILENGAGPAWCFWAGEPDAFGVVMPLRVSGISTTPPAWAK